MLESGWNIGGYGYIDRRRSETGNRFSQATFGVEALGRDFDVRGNVYRPRGTKVRSVTAGGGDPYAELVGSSIQVTTPGSTTQEERALKGFDAEVGYRLPIFEAEDGRQLRVYAGGFRFSSGSLDLSGWRARAEFTLAQLPGLWEGAQLVAGAETQNDNVRGTLHYLNAQLRIPFGGAARTRSLTAQERRMTAAIVRDVDIVTRSRTLTAPAQVETATQTADGATITVIDSASTSGTAALQTSVVNAGNNSFVILNGTFNTTNAIQLQTGQTLMGAGTVTVRTPGGATAPLTAPGATINATTASNSIGAFSMANDSTLTGMTIVQRQDPANVDPRGVNAEGVSNATISNNTISVSGTNGNAFGTYVIDSSNITISGNTIAASRIGATGIALYVNNSSATVAGNTLSATGNTIYAAYLVAGIGDTVTILSGSTGNVFAAGSGGSTTGTGTFNGVIGYTDSGGASHTLP